MGKICDLVKAFEDECANGLVSGSASAHDTKLLYPSRKTSDLDERHFSQRLLVRFQELRLNGVSVIFPTEGYTGADIEIHVLLKNGGWCGLRLQAKRAVTERSSLTFRELAHPNGTGTQNSDLFESSLNDEMSPLYLYYIPRDFVNAVGSAMSISGAMVGSAWDAKTFIDQKVFLAKTIISKNTVPLSSMLCPLEYDDQHFVQAVEGLFSDHIEVPFQSELDIDLDELLPELYNVERPFLEQAESFQVARRVPERVKNYFEQGVWPRIQEHSGAIMVNRKVFVT